MKHKNKFSKSDFGWKKDFDAMAKKTVLRNILSKWGILSIEMQRAYETDQAFIKDDVANGAEINSANIEYMDNEIQDIEFEVSDNEPYEGTPFNE